MAETFLEEQLKRIREMSDWMTRARDHAAEVSAELARDRELIRKSPLDEVRDFRSHSSIENDRSSSAHDHGRRGRRSRNRRK
jgi:hypothetical protein